MHHAAIKYLHKHINVHCTQFTVFLLIECVIFKNLWSLRCFFIERKKEHTFIQHRRIELIKTDLHCKK